MSAAPTLSVEGLSLRFDTPGGPVHALSDISFTVGRGEILSLVGESGCGKSVTAMAIMGLLPRHSARIGGGAVMLGDENLLGMSERRLREIRGNRIGMIFQDPMTCLNPVHTVGMQIAETVRRHRGLSRGEAMARARQMLDLVRIPDAAGRLHDYPHQLSGGMRQRVMIAMALACEPELLIADEPTTALDVTVQAQILDLIADLKAEIGTSVILITHDLGVVAQTADRVMVMYAGRIVEEGTVEAVFARPSHGYTAGLLQSLPAGRHQQPLNEIAGSVPRLDREIEACPFAPRCAFARPACTEPLPPAHPVSGQHRTACIRADAVYADVCEHDFVRAWA